MNRIRFIKKKKKKKVRKTRPEGAFTNTGWFGLFCWTLQRATQGREWRTSAKTQKEGTFLGRHRLLFNLSQPLHELVLLPLYPLLLFLCILPLLLLILQLSPVTFWNDAFQTRVYILE